MRVCETEGCVLEADLAVWVNDEQGNRIVEEDACGEHFIQILRRHSDKDVPWPIYGPASQMPWRFIKASEALRLMGLEFA